MSGPWWRRGIIYQVYPRSFQDSDSDGVGDLRGITSRLDYLRWLGVDAVWISPFYPSPMADFGYDVSDHRAVDPLFGTLEDFDRLVAEAHARGLRVILDFVPNHTSDRHPWFLESRASRDAPKRGWYVWRDPAPDGGPPNNWISAFGGSAWERDAASGQYYLHTFLREQPDLDWSNPEVVEAMLDVLRFWLERGADGFRVDAVQNLGKDRRLRDNPPNPAYRPGTDDPYDALLREHSCDGPATHELIARMREVVDGYGGERVLLGEIYNTVERLMPYYGEAGGGCHFPYNFQLIRLPWEARTIGAAVRRYEGLLPPGAWPNWVLGNHDRPRVASRVGPEQARVAAMLLLTLRGTPTLYYGDEVGMRDVPIPPELVRDPWEKNLPGRGLGRDPVRTPMQWDDSESAGFTAGTPWLPLADDFREVNVAAQRDDPASLLSLYRRLVALRRAETALHSGAWEHVDAEGDLLAYRRSGGGRRFLVALNLGAETRSLEMGRGTSGRVALSTTPGRDGEGVERTLVLRGAEGVVMRLD
ncbi:MAG TPA: alpha-amylase family glycosyl hydrolase [Longimicrobiaceae bacterium]|nr:alpha-amylase family glycosyl hydrolase [Longimicrobiaceae bacterium]